MTTRDIAIVGAGPAGLCMALALADAGHSPLVIGAPHKPSGTSEDTRTAALFAPSIDLLRNLGVWTFCEPHSAPLRAIRLVDDTGGVFRAPEVVFSATEIGLEAFGWNVPQMPLINALRETIDKKDSITLRNTQGVRSATPRSHQVELHLCEGDDIACRMAIASDGRRSVLRSAAGISAHSTPSNTDRRYLHLLPQPPPPRRLDRGSSSRWAADRRTHAGQPLQPRLGRTPRCCRPPFAPWRTRHLHGHCPAISQGFSGRFPQFPPETSSHCRIWKPRPWAGTASPLSAKLDTPCRPSAPRD